MFSDLLYRLRAVFRRRRIEAEMEEELRFHLDCETEKQRRAGITLGEADRISRRAFGGSEQIREECRDARGVRWLSDFVQDLRYALRLIRKNAGFSMLVVFVLALGIGANTAVFSIVHAVLLKPLPFRDPARLLAVWDTYLPQFSTLGISPLELQAWETQCGCFEETAWYRSVPQDGNLAVAGSEPIAVHANFISTNLFPMLGVKPLLGRGFFAKEDPHSMLLSNRLWHSRFKADAGVIGKTVHLNQGQFTVVGVMPAAGQFPDWADLWLPPGPLMADELTNPVRHALGFLARLLPGVDQQQAAGRMLAISQRLAKEHPKTSSGWGIRVSKLQDDLTGDIRPALLMLLGAASILLLIACTNIASLLLSRASARTKEMAVRTALGASGRRIVQQLLTESVVLALLGGGFGLLFAKVALLLTLHTRAVHPDLMVVLFLIATTLLAGVLFGLAPALQTLRTDAQTVIKSASATSSGITTRSTLVVFEFALTIMLVIGAAILAKSFNGLLHVNPGFDPKGILTLRVLTPQSRNPEALFHRMQEKLTALPGVQGVAVTNALPLIANRANASRFNIPGNHLIQPDALPAAQIRTMSPDYFRVMRVALRAGHTFTDRDLKQPVVMINEAMARRFWPGKNPIGLKFVTGPWDAPPTWSRIIGVVADVKQFGLDSEPTMDIYYPGLAAQYVIVKATGDPLALAGVVDRSLHALDPELAISEMRSMDQIVNESARKRRWTMGLLTTFAGLALLLALAGIYGVMAWSVAQRSREIGIRMALGAQRRQVLWLVLGNGMKLAVAGAALGMAGSLALRHTLAALVYGVSTADPLIYFSAAASMLLVSLLACYLPARRASNVDPSISLRYE